MSDETILQEAESLINGDRQQQYGGASESFTRIGELWGAYLGAPVSALDVANLMVLLKVSRTKGKYHRDSYVDIAGYSALAERITAEDATLGVLIDTPLEYVEVPPEPRVWGNPDEIPEGVVVTDVDGGFWKWESGRRYLDRGKDKDGTIRWDSGEAGPNDWLRRYTPFTEVAS